MKEADLRYVQKWLETHIDPKPGGPEASSHALADYRLSRFVGSLAVQAMHLEGMKTLNTAVVRHAALIDFGQGLVLCVQGAMDTDGGSIVGRRVLPAEESRQFKPNELKALWVSLTYANQALVEGATVLHLSRELMGHCIDVGSKSPTSAKTKAIGNVLGGFEQSMDKWVITEDVTQLRASLGRVQDAIVPGIGPIATALRSAMASYEKAHLATTRERTAEGSAEISA